MPFVNRHLTPSSISAAKPIVVTSAGHGLSNGQFVRATNFFTVPIAEATGMEQLNNRLFMVWNVTADTFGLYQNGEPVDGTNYTPFVANQYSSFTVTGPELNIQNLIV